MIKKLFTILFSMAVVTAFGAVTKGSCESAAVGISVGKSVTVRLTPEYDPDFKEYDSDNGVYYFSVTLTRGLSYTLTYSGSAADSVDVSVYPREATDAEFDKDIYEPFASFDDAGEFNGVYVQYLESDSWDAEDPASWKYYIVVSGDVNDTVTVSLANGIVPYATPGTADNPTTITMADTANSGTYTFADGEYHFVTALRAGRLYRIRTTGGTEALPVALDVDSNVDFDVIDDPDYAGIVGNAAVIVAPATSGNFTLTASGSGANFGLIWQSIPMRAITAHTSTPLNAVNGYSATFQPGRAISSYSYADNIIDEHLCSIALAKGDRWVFDTEGATVETRMVLYDSRGTILATNETKGNGSYDLRIAYAATSAGTYYIGVCEKDLGVTGQASGAEIVLTAEKVASTDGDPDEWDMSDDTVTGATPLSPLPGTELSDLLAEGTSHGPHRLDRKDWSDCFQIAVRKGITYVLTAAQTGEEKTDLTLKAKVFTVSGSTEREVSSSGGIDPLDESPLTFTPTANATYYIRVSVAEGQGLDYPEYTIYSMAYTTSGAQLGILTVNTPGAPSATWSLGSESVKYPSGSSVLVSGTQTVKLSTVSGYKAAVSSTTVTVNPGAEPTVVEVKYSDTFDPKDDAPAGRTGNVSHSATALSFKNVETEYARRTLWEDDPEDNFAITGADGYYYDISLKNVEGDDVTFSITNAENGVVAENVTVVSQLTMPKTKSKYFLAVKNGDKATAYGGYSLFGKFANVGAIKFARTAVSARENAASVVITVNRTARDGVVRVKYGTVAGTAKPGEDYIAQNGVLEWANGDNKAKTITVKLIPDLVPFYEGNKTFTVQLKAFEDDEREASEYPASIVGGDTCTVTLTETSRATDTVESAYAKVAPRLATVKTETVPLETGTFYGVLSEDGSALTNGLPQLASVTLTASVPTSTRPSRLSAKVALAGKTYTFTAEGWDDGETEGTLERELSLVQRLNRLDEETGRTVSVTVTNTLVVTAASGETATDGDWLKSGGTATLVMNVPDTNNKGYQEEIRYTGAIYRQNAKIQDYLTAVTNFTGYYTVALAATGVDALEAPAGNGYITLTIDNKGMVRAAGMLADGTTRPSLSVAACAIKEDESSANGYSMYVPLFFARSPAVFGGELRLYAGESGEIVVDSSRPLVWNNDNARLTYYGEEGYRLSLDPAGGWYDKVVNLQAYYLTRAFEVSAPDASEFFTEALTANSATKDYHFVDAVQPDGTTVDLAGDAFSTARKTLVRSGTLYDLAASSNPCNVQVKLARATGLVTGTFSLWSENEDGSKQKEITGLKHFGVLVMNRDEAAPLDGEIVCAGFCTQAIKVSDYNETTGRTTSRSITASMPFNLLGVDQGEPDWWADDWGEPE